MLANLNPFSYFSCYLGKIVNSFNYPFNSLTLVVHNLMGMVAEHFPLQFFITIIALMNHQPIIA